MNPSAFLKAGIAALALASGGCSALPSSTGQASDAPVASIDPKVKFKDGDRYLGDLSRALNMPRETICKELSRYDCFSDAFRIVLGGVEAPNMTVHVPLEEAALTAPIALDRVALHVCTSRVRLDREDPSTAVLYRTSSGTAPGRPDKAWMEATTDELYGVLLNREPTSSERKRLVGFYKDVATENGKPNPDAASDWVTLGCFALASSLESIFY
jgi:hypothetical protein